MARVFTSNVVIESENGPQFFGIGEVVPEWAFAKIGDHIVGLSDNDSPATPDLSDGVEESLADETPDEGEESSEEESSDDEDPYANWSKNELKAEAQERGISGATGMNMASLKEALIENDAEEA